ncbi:fatty acid hydroxylase family protein [archaeon]|nr:MAG: fatty acid hydroxylase family protein [archaeon]
MKLSLHSVAASCVIFFGYIAHSSFLQYWFYVRRKDCVSDWKIQSNNTNTVGTLWGWSFFSSKPHRAPLHSLITCVNLFIASCFALMATECSVRRVNRMTYEDFDVNLLPTIFCQVLLACTYESLAEYYWHRLMHLKFFYIAFHKMHHQYKAPEPFDDMYIHPVEAFGYYCILYAPPFLFTMHYVSFIAYMVIMGIFGVMDHSGIKFSIPAIYNTVDHDSHHAKFEVNYSFPFPYLDILHGTFEGEFLGRQYTRKRTIWDSISVSKHN